MKTKIIISNIILAIFLLFPHVLNAAEGTGGLSFFGKPTSEEEIGGVAVSAEKAEQIEAQKISWFQKQLKILNLSDKKTLFQEKSVANIRKRIKDQMEFNKNYTLQGFIEMSQKAEQLGQTVSSYGEHMILQDDGSIIRYYDGRPTDIFNMPEIDNRGNKRISNIMNISYEASDEFVVDNISTTTHTTGYIKLVYDPINTPLNAIDYLKYEDAIYQSNIDDRPSAYTTVEGSVEQQSDWALYEPDSTDSAKQLYDKIVNQIIPEVEAGLKYKVTTAFTNVQYYTLPQDTATTNSAGGVYGEKASYDFGTTSTDAPNVTETGTVSDIQYYLLDKGYTEPLSEYWWHAQDAELTNLHHGQEAKEASSHTTLTRLGITKEIDFYDAVYDSYNSLSSYKESYKIDGTETESYHYHNISYNAYGRKISYTVDGDIYGLPFTKSYSDIEYDSLSRVTGYKMSETISGSTTEYVYWDINYNDLWQQTSYYYSVDGVEHYRSSITYNSYGLVESYMETYVEDGVSVTKYRYNTYTENGLISSYTEEILRQSSTVHEFYYVYVGNITYNNIYAITSFKQITIKDENATTMTDYSAKIPLLISSLTYDGIHNPTTTGGWSDWGFNDSVTAYIYKYCGITYYPVGSYSGGDYYDLSIEPSFRGRANSYAEAVRTVTSTSDEVEVITMP